VTSFSDSSAREQNRYREVAAGRQRSIQEVAALAQGEVRRNSVALRTELAHDLPPVVGDRVQLQQVILNLVMNGVEAMASMADRPRELFIYSQQHESDKVLVAVRDSGTGLHSENLDQLFKPFFSTKPKGMGMGLAISRAIIESHGGRLWAAANESRGAVFQFTLPTDGEGES
jgi:C4-dicarboxylate-specific signal transduction histidine kinase